MLVHTAPRTEPHVFGWDHSAASPGQAMTAAEPADVAVIGAGPAGVFAALWAAQLGARTALVTRDAVGGMAASDGPVPVRALAQAARLRREARHLHRYGIDMNDTPLDYRRLLARVREVVADVAEHSVMRTELQDAGVVPARARRYRQVRRRRTPSQPSTASACTQTGSSSVRAAPTGLCRWRARNWSARTGTPGH